MTQARWMQEQAIAYECARELIGHLMPIKSMKIEGERSKPLPDHDRIETPRQERFLLDRERQDLRVTDDTAIAKTRTDYGEIVRAHLCTED